MSRIDRVELKNWMAFKGENAVDLPTGPIAVVGEYANNERRSNWAGKCLPGTALVYTESGPVPIAQAVADRIPTVLGIDDRLNVVPRKVVDWMRLGPRACVELRMADGTKLRAARTHPVMTSRGTIPAGEVAVGDRMAGVRALPFGKVQPVVSMAEARLIGLLLGDGTVTTNQIKFTTSDPGLTELFERLVPEVFPGLRATNTSGTNRVPTWSIVSKLAPEKRRVLNAEVVSLVRDAGVPIEIYIGKNTARFWRGETGLSGATMAAIEVDYGIPMWSFICALHPQEAQGMWLTTHGLIGRNSYTKEVSFTALPEAETIELLVGLWDTDGYVGCIVTRRPEISYSTCSKRLAEQVRFWLLSIGILSVTFERTTRDQHGTPVDSHCIRVLGNEHSDRFTDLIGKRLVAGKKAARLYSASAQTWRQQGRQDVIPNEFCRDLAKTSASGKKRTAGQLARLGMSRETFVDFGGDQSLTNLRWTEVVAIRDAGVEEMFDLELDDEPRYYIADEYVVHNSAFLEAIRWACWGIHRKRTEDKLIYTGEDMVSVCVSFSDGATIERARPRGGPTRVVFRFPTTPHDPDDVMGEDAQEAIGAYLGLTYQDARATVLIEQGDTEALVGRTSSQRRETIAAWLELDLWDRLAKRARAGSAAAAERVTVLRQSPDALATTERDDATIRADIARAEKDRNDAILGERTTYEELKLAHASTAARSAAHRLESGIAEGKALRDRIIRLPVVESEAVDDQLDANLTASRERLTIAQRTEDMARVNASGRFDGVCPVTRRNCAVADDVRADRTATADAFRVAADERSAADKEHREWASADEVRRSQKQERDRLTTLFNAKTAEVRRLRAEVDASAVPVDVSTVDAERAHDAARANTSRAEAELAALKAEAARSESSAKRRADHTAQLIKAERDAKRAALVLRALSPSGIQARVASAALVSLEERANALLSGSGLSFSLAWERELSDPAPTCIECGHVFKGRKDKTCPSCTAVRGAKRSDELDVLVRDDSGEEEDVREKSGGARALVASAIRLAGGAMLRERRSSTVAWALVDEPFGSLDQENRESLARSFSSMLGSVGLEQALIVSHDAALLAAMPHTIRVIRDGAVSRLEIV